MHKAKIGPDRACVGPSIRLNQLLCQNYLGTLEKDLHSLEDVLQWVFSNGGRNTLRTSFFDSWNMPKTTR